MGCGRWRPRCQCWSQPSSIPGAQRGGSPGLTSGCSWGRLWSCCWLETALETSGPECLRIFWLDLKAWMCLCCTSWVQVRITKRSIPLLSHFLASEEVNPLGMLFCVPLCSTAQVLLNFLKENLLNPLNQDWWRCRGKLLPGLELEAWVLSVFLPCCGQIAFPAFLASVTFH